MRQAGPTLDPDLVGIADINKIEAVRRRRCGTDAPIPPRKQFTGPGLVLTPGADFYQRGSDVPDHVMEEGVGANIDSDDIVRARDANPVDVPVGRPRTAGCCTVGGEIMFADKGLRGAIHSRLIERSPLMREAV